MIDSWSCSRCDSFGSVRPGEDPRCECDEAEDALREQLAAVTAERDSLRAEVERLRGINAESGEWIDSAANIEVALRSQLAATRAALNEACSKLIDLIAATTPCDDITKDARYARAVELSKVARDD